MEHTHMRTCTLDTHRAASMRQPYKNKLYHINHVNPLLFLSWPSLIPSHTLSSLPCSLHQSCLSSIPLFPLIHPFNLACACVGWSICSSSDERMSSTSPANQSTAGSTQTLFTCMPSRRYRKGLVTLVLIVWQMLSMCLWAKFITAHNSFLKWLADAISCKSGHKGDNHIIYEAWTGQPALFKQCIPHKKI